MAGIVLAALSAVANGWPAIFVSYTDAAGVNSATALALRFALAAPLFACLALRGGVRGVRPRDAAALGAALPYAVYLVMDTALVRSVPPEWAATGVCTGAALTVVATNGTAVIADPPPRIDYDGGMAMAWRDLRYRVGRHMADLLELPREVVLDLPKIIVVGDVQVLIENHRGIVAYGPDEVRVSVGEREVTVQGRELVLRHVHSEELLVEGQITGLSFR